MGKRHAELIKVRELANNDIDIKVASEKSVRVHSRKSSLSDFGHLCTYDNLQCKRYDYVLEDGACFTYDLNGRLKFVCKRFVAPVGFMLPKHLSPEQMKDSADLDKFTL